MIQHNRTRQLLRIIQPIKLDLRQRRPVNTGKQRFPHLHVLQAWRLTIKHAEILLRPQRAPNINILHALRNRQRVLRSHIRGINLPSLERINGGLRLHLPKRHPIQLRLLPPPLFIGHKRHGAAVIVVFVHLIRARPPLRVRILQIALIKRLRIRHPRMHQNGKQCRPPRVGLLKRHHHLLVRLAGGNALNEIITIRGIHHDVFILTIAQLPRVLKHPPIQWRAIIIGGIRVDVVSNYRFPIHHLILNIGQICWIRMPRPIPIKQHQLRVIPIPQVRRIHHRITMRRVRLLRYRTHRQIQLPAIPNLVALQRVIVPRGFNLHAARRIRRRRTLRRTRTSAQHQRRSSHHRHYRHTIRVFHHHVLITSLNYFLAFRRQPLPPHPGHTSPASVFELP